jgi:hypothetical protein
MFEDQDSEFIPSIFLMETRDAPAAVEDCVHRMATGEPLSSIVPDPLGVGADRRKDGASLHGHPGVSAPALVMHEVNEGLPAAPVGQILRRVDLLGGIPSPRSIAWSTRRRSSASSCSLRRAAGLRSP